MMNMTFAILSSLFVTTAALATEQRDSVMQSVRELNAAFEHDDRVNYMRTTANDPSAMAEEFFTKTYEGNVANFVLKTKQSEIKLNANHIGFLEDGRTIYKSIMTPLNVIVDNLAAADTLTPLQADELKKVSRVAITNLRRWGVVFGYDGYTSNLQNSNKQMLYIFDKNARRIYSVDMTTGWSN